MELTAALLILLAEYFALLPPYIQTLLRVLKSDAHGVLIGVFIGSLIGFMVLRPIALYLLWRGTNWVRTLIIWAIPVALVLSVIRALTPHALGAARPADIPHSFIPGLVANLSSRVALIVGLAALLVLYVPRVGAWFRYMKETHARVIRKRTSNNRWRGP